MDEKNVIKFPFGQTRVQNVPKEINKEKAQGGQPEQLPETNIVSIHKKRIESGTGETPSSEPIQRRQGKSTARRIAEVFALRSHLTPGITLDQYLMRLYSSDPETAKEFSARFSRLGEMESALASLRTQMTQGREAANVSLRRTFMRSSGTQDLTDQFFNSTVHDWTAHPSTYIALLDELDERGFFSGKKPSSPTEEAPKEPPTPPTPKKPRIKKTK